jgi:AcrR family transcriptional regulator
MATAVRPNRAKAHKTEPRPYHHGDLRLALIAATIQLIEAGGIENVTVREAARLVGVSSGAPFRHFPSRTALLTAVAEQALDRFVAEIDLTLDAAAGDDPLMRYRAVGVAFLRWAIANPAHFQVISARTVIDFEGSTLRSRNEAIRTRIRALMAEAQKAGLLREGSDPHQLAIAGRAMVYGLARMFVDGQFPSWGLDEDKALAECEGIFDAFIASIVRSK